MNSIEQDAARYRWLKQKRNLILRSDGSWYTYNGKKYQNSHYLAADDIQFPTGDTLDEIIDLAMEIQQNTKRHE